MTEIEKVPFATELSVADFKHSLNFYSSLGFETLRIDEESKFATLMFHGAILMIWQERIDSPKGQGINLRFYMDSGLQEHYDRAKSLGIKVTQPFKKTDYGLDEYYVEDPDGYRVRFCTSTI